MALPADVSTFVLHGKYADYDGNPITGSGASVTLTFGVRSNDVASHTTLVPSSVTVALDSSGMFQKTLANPSDPDLTPNGFTIAVKENFASGSQFSFEVPPNAVDIYISNMTTGVPDDAGTIVYAQFATLEEETSQRTLADTALDTRIDALEAAGTAAPTTYVGLTGNQTIGGTKTFSIIPVLPAQDPVSANQATRKFYVDAGDAAVTAHIDAFEALAGAPNGLATLDGTSKVPSAQLLLASSAPPAVGTGAAGTSTTLARRDHTHDGVALTGDQTVAGIKTFSSSPIVPTPTTSTQVANKSYVDANGAAPALTVTQFLASTKPWQVGHRGVGDDCEEHTFEGYDRAAAAGLLAMEVSCSTAAGGALVCMHDVTVDRTTNLTGNLTNYTVSEIRSAMVNKPDMYGPASVAKHPPLLTEVLDRHLGKMVIFLEAKTSAAIVPLQNLLTNRYPKANQSVIIKGYYTSSMWAWAKANGFTTWGYLDATTALTDAGVVANQANIDIWGLPYAMTDQLMIDWLNKDGKPCMCWEVHKRYNKTRLLALTGTGTKKAMDGLVVTDPAYLNATAALKTTTNWALGIREPGEQPRTDYTASTALVRTAATASVHSPNLSGGSNGIYQLCPPPDVGNGYKITFDMMYPILPAANLHGGLYFGRTNDSNYTFSSTTNTVGGYHMVYRPNEGLLQVYRHDAGVATGVSLASVGSVSQALTAGQWASFEIDVLAASVRAKRLDVAMDTTALTDVTYRGAFLGIHNGSITAVNTAPEIRNLAVTAL